jgi:hypothetical protein
MFSVEPFHSSDLPALRALFRGFPYKALQQRMQGLDSDLLADLFSEDEHARLEKSGSQFPTQWTVHRDGELTAFAGLSPDMWHSESYPWRFGRIAPFLIYRASSEARAELVRVLLAEAGKAGYQHLITRVDGSEYEAVRALLDAGFLIVDCSVKMSGRIEAVPVLARPSRAAGMSIRPYQSADLPVMQRIVASSHPHNHYYNDPWLSHEGTDRLFAAWIERCCEKMRSNAFVLEHRGEARGFIIYLHPQRLNQRMGTKLIILDLVCLDRETQGGGVGRWLIAETLRGFAPAASMVELRTSQNNYPALNCYADLGMRIVSTDFILHGHLSAKETSPC